MIKLVLRQVFFMVTSFFGITLITFYLQTLQSTADATVASLTETTAEIESQQVVINPPSYFTYLSNVLQGDLGTSRTSGMQVSNEFLTHLPASVELVVLATILAILIGLPLGVISAIYHRRATDLVINNLSLIAYSMPIFWWGIILLMYFSITQGVTPVAGRLNFLFDIEPVTGFILIDTFFSEESYRIDAFKDAINHLLLPVIVLATLPAAIIARLARQNMIQTLSKDFILTAQAKGLSSFRIYWIHGLRNAMIPFLDMLSLQISTLMTGAMLTEYLFSWPGIGKWIIDALQNNDYQSLQGGILLTTIMVVFINASIELLQIWLNPRLRKQDRISNIRVGNG